MRLVAVWLVVKGRALAVNYHSSSPGSLPSHGAHSLATYKSFRMIGDSVGSIGVCVGALDKSWDVSRGRLCGWLEADRGLLLPVQRGQVAQPRRALAQQHRGRVCRRRGQS